MCGCEACSLHCLAQELSADNWAVCECGRVPGTGLWKRDTECRRVLFRLTLQANVEVCGGGVTRVGATPPCTGESRGVHQSAHAMLFQLCCVGQITDQNYMNRVPCLSLSYRTYIPSQAKLASQCCAVLIKLFR